MRKILVALDSSSVASPLLGAAIQFAERFGGGLVLLRSVSLPVELPSSVFTISTDSALTVFRDQAQQELAELAKAVPAALLVAAQVRVGGPAWRAVCEVAKEEAAAMIIIGSHGHGGLQRMLGTTAAKVVDHAECTVVVVRAADLLF